MDTTFDTLLRHAGLSPPERLVQLTRPDDFEFEALVTDDHLDYARTLLVWARSSNPGYRPPDQQKRHVLRTPSRESLKLDEEKWTFTKHEVGKAFNALFEFNPLPDVGVARGLLSFVEDLYELDELWAHFQDCKLQKRLSGLSRQSVSPSHTIASWLESAAKQGNTNYIRLMCQYRATQAMVDQAFIVALSRQDMDSAHVLATFGASIGSSHADIVQGYVKRGDIGAVRLLLAVPNGLSTEDWQDCFLKEFTAGAPSMNVTKALLQCVHHDSSIASVALLLKALEAEDTAAVAVLLAYRATSKSVAGTDTASCFLSLTGSHQEHESMALQACLCVCEIKDAGTRYTLWSLLSQVGLLRASPALQSEMDLIVDSLALQSEMDLIVYPAIPRLPDHGFDINLAHGEIMKMLVPGSDNSLLWEARTSSSSTTSALKTAFKATHGIKPRDSQLQQMTMLLDEAYPAEIGQSDRLAEETMEALSSEGDQKGLELLLRHKASVNANGGKALRIAAAMSVGSTAVLETLLSQSPSASVIALSCHAALKSLKLDQSQKEAILKLLLAANPSLTEAEVSDLLHRSISRLGNSMFLPTTLIIKRHAKVSFQHLEAALTSSSKELFEFLVRNFGPDKDKCSFFVHACKADIESDRRIWLCDTMLKNWHIPKASVSKALVSALGDDSLVNIALPKFLLQRGAGVNFDDSLPLRLSFKLRDPMEISELLVQHIKDGHAAGVAFQAASASPTLESESKLHFYRILSKHNISKDLLSQGLIETLKYGQDIATIRFLLARGANPGAEEAKCFILAYKAKNSVAFKAMCPHAEVDTIICALLEHLSEEKDVITWLDLCMGTLAPPAARLKDPWLLYRAMRRFPDGGALVIKLLEYGVPAGSLTKLSLCEHWKIEEVTPLLWALLQGKKVSNTILLALIARGQEAKPLYLTPKSQVSAAFACMLKPGQTPILEALLEQHGKLAMDYIIPARSFTCLGQSPRKPSPEDMVQDDLSLSSAALYLGNFEAYRVLQGGENTDDGSLHTAALLALPDFVKWLLKHHSADHPHGGFGMMIPLAVACRSQARPWCKIGNANGTFAERQKVTMRFLAERTNLSWRYRRMSVLHFAIDGGPDTVTAMLKALRVAEDPQRNNRYLYTDKGGTVYSLSKYISHIVDPDNKRSESKTMIQILQDVGKLKDRMWQSPDGI